MAQDLPLNPQQQKKLSKKAAQALQIQEELSPPWFPDAAWHLKTLATIYVLLTAGYFGVSYLLSHLPKPYRLRDIPPEMTPWLAPGGKQHLSDEALRAPQSPTLPSQPTDRLTPSSTKK